MSDYESDSAYSVAQAMGKSEGAKNYVKFYREWVRNNFRSKQEGREVGEDRDFILIVSPGQPKTEVRREAKDADKATYAHEWEAYLAGKEHQQSGTPIELLPGLPRGMAQALKALYIYTIEQMAELPDVHLHKVGMGGGDLRRKAQEYITGGKGAILEMQTRMEAAEAQARAQIEALQAQVAELQEQLAEATKPKRGRKPKLAVAA